MANHHLEINDVLWGRILELYGITDKRHHRTAMNNARDLLSTAVTVELMKKMQGHVALPPVDCRVPEPKTASTAVQSIPDNEIGTDSCSDHWPVANFQVISLMRFQGLPTSLLKPNSDDYNDKQTRHLEEKKAYIRAGYRFEGMDDAELAMEHALGDIDDRRLWDDLPDGAQAAHRIIKRKFREWLRLKNRVTS